MKFVGDKNVMTLKVLLDPQGKAVSLSMNNIGYKNVANVRIGKHISLEIEAESKEVAETQVDELCKKILSNPIMEGYEFEVNEA